MRVVRTHQQHSCMISR